MQKSITRGIVAGITGGLVGSVILKAFILAARKLHTGSTTTGNPPTDFDQRGPSHQVAELAFRKATGRSLTPAQRVLGGEIVHYAFGAVNGAIYGVVAEYAPWSTWGQGTLFGTAVFLAADETSMPALGLTNKPWEEPGTAQLEKWAAHLAFGVGAELTRQAVRRLL